MSTQSVMGLDSSRHHGRHTRADTIMMSRIGAAVVVLLAVWMLMRHTKIGLIMRATQLDGEMAQVVGGHLPREHGRVGPLQQVAGALEAQGLGPLDVQLDQRDARDLLGRDEVVQSHRRNGDGRGHL